MILLKRTESQAVEGIGALEEALVGVVEEALGEIEVVGEVEFSEVVYKREDLVG